MFEKLKGRDFRVIDLEKAIKDKHLQLEDLETQCRKLKKALGQLEGAGRINEQIETQLDLAAKENAINNIQVQVNAEEKELEKAKNVEGREDAEKRLYALGVEAKKQRDLYEKMWKQIHSYLEKNAPIMVKAFKEWGYRSEEFYELLIDIEPGSREGNWVGKTAFLKTRAGEFFDEMQKKGIDLPTLLWWTRLRTTRTFRLPVLDGPYLKALDFAHEVAMYGPMITAKIRQRWNIRHTSGIERKKHTAKDKRRPEFPLSLAEKISSEEIVMVKPKYEE